MRINKKGEELEFQAKPHFNFVDIAKGICIILVVMGHAIPDASTGRIADPFLNFTNAALHTTRMPLFFFLAAFLVTAPGAPVFTFIKKRFSRLIIPYIFVGIAYLPFKLLLSSFANHVYSMDKFWQILIGVNPDGELWFLYVLFVVSIAYRLIGNRINSFMLLASLLVLIVGIHIKLPGELGLILWYQLYYALGLYVRNHQLDKFLIYLKEWKIAILSLVIFALGNALRISGATGILWIGTVLAGLSGIAFFINISMSLAETNGKLRYFFERIGYYCMDVYILSDIIKIPVRIVFWSKLHLYYTSFIVGTIIAVGMSIILGRYIIRQNRYLRKVILGMD